MTNELSNSAKRVQDYLESRGVALEVKEFPASTHTAQDAADAVGCQVGQIVKSLIFKGGTSGRAVLILASGANRVDEKRVTELLGEKIKKADADFVRQQTGYAIGGVPPVAHLNPPITLMDEDLMAYGEVWAAAGTPHAVFRLTPAQLAELTEPKVACIK